MLLRSRTMFIVPLVLCVVAIFQDILLYKMRQHVKDMYERAAIVLLLNGVLFGIAAAFLAPRMQKFLMTLGKESKRAGTIGIWIFYVGAYGLLFYVYLVIEKYGIASLLPKSLR